MSRYRGVFIAPSTINKRAHRRSKTHPPVPQYKTELSHHPREDCLSPVLSHGAPSIPCLLKEVTLKFKPEEKRETTELVLPEINSPRRVGSEEVRPHTQNIDFAVHSPAQERDSPLCDHGEVPSITYSPRSERNTRGIPLEEEADAEKSFQTHCKPISGNTRTGGNNELFCKTRPIDLGKNCFETQSPLVESAFDNPTVDTSDLLTFNSNTVDGKVLSYSLSTDNSTSNSSTDRNILGSFCSRSVSDPESPRYDVGTQTLPYSEFRILPQIPTKSKQKANDQISADNSQQKKVLTFGKTVYPEHFESKNNLNPEFGLIRPGVQSEQSTLEQQCSQSVLDFSEADQFQRSQPHSCSIDNDYREGKQSERTSSEEKELDIVHQVNTQQENNEFVTEESLIPLKPTLFLESESSGKSTCNKSKGKSTNEPGNFKTNVHSFSDIDYNTSKNIEFQDKAIRPEEARVHQVPHFQEKFATISANTKKAIKPALIIENTDGKRIFPDKTDQHIVNETNINSTCEHFEVADPSDNQSTRRAPVKETAPGHNTFGQEAFDFQEKVPSNLPSPCTFYETLSPSFSQKPIIFNFETEQKLEHSVLVDSGFETLQGTTEDSSEYIETNSVCSLSNSFSEEFDFTLNLNTSSNILASTPVSKREKKDPHLCEIPLHSDNISGPSNLNINKANDDIHDSSEMASLPSQNVKVKKELLENREKIKELEEKLVNERKLSESKDRSITSLTKELEEKEKHLEIDVNNNKNYDEMKSKILSLETDNRILNNQVKMVEDANKQLYKEVYEAKTQLRFHERKAEDSTTQHGQTSRRLSQALQSSMDKSTGFTVFLHQMETDLISTESALRKLKAQRQALEEVLESGEQKPEVYLPFPFNHHEKESFLTEEVKTEIRAQFHDSLERNFDDEESKEKHCDKRIEELENIINHCVSAKFEAEKEKVAASEKKINLTKVHARAIKDIEGKCMDIKLRSEKQIASMKGRIANEVKELSKEISGIYLAKQERKPKPRRKFSSIESPEKIRKKSVEEMAKVGHAMRTIRSKSNVNRNDLSENEKEILSLNEKMSKNLDDTIQMSDELLETQYKIKELENRYDDKHKEAEMLERELSSKRNEIAIMAKEMQEALKHVSPDKMNEDSPLFNDPSQSEKTTKDVQCSDKEVQVEDLKDELMQTMLLLEVEQKEREEALRMNEDLFLELENREQEISNLVVQLEELKSVQKPTNSSNPNACKRLSEMIASLEPTTLKDELVQLERDLTKEMEEKESEAKEMNIELTKHKQDAESLLVLIDYYKDEMAILQQEKQDKTDAVDKNHKYMSSEQQLDLVNHNTREGQSKLHNDITELQNTLAQEMETAKKVQDKVNDLEEALRKERQAKEYAYKRNKELEEDLRIKDVKLNNLASAVTGAQTQEQPVATAMIFELKATMAQIQSENETLSSEMDCLASDLESTSVDNKVTPESATYEESTINDSLFDQTDGKDDHEVENESGDFQVIENDGDQIGNNVTPESYVAQATGVSEGEGAHADHGGSTHNDQSSILPGISNNVQSEASSLLRNQCDSSKQDLKKTQTQDTKATDLTAEKDEIVNELEHTIETLEKEVEHLRSENTLLENEAMDILDDGLKVENKILRNQVSRLSNELAIARADEDDMKREFEHVEDRSKDMQESIVKLTSAKNELLYSNENLTFQNKILNEELVLLRNKVEVLEEETKIIAGEVVGIEVVDSKAFVQENEALKTDIAKITLALEVNKDEVERLQTELGVSEGNVKELKGKLSSLNKEKSRLEIMVDDLSFQNKSQEKEMNLLQKKIGVLEEEIKIIEQDLKQRSDEVKVKEVAIESITKESEKKESEKKQLEELVKEKEKAFEIAKLAEEKQLKQLVEKNFSLQVQLNKFEMNSNESKQEQQRLERDLNELRDRLREADKKFNFTKEEKMKSEDSLGTMKTRVEMLQRDLNDAKSEIREKNEIIRKLNLKNSELQITLAQKEEELRREEKLRMDNMKSLDALKIKLEKTDVDDKKQRDRLFSLKSACSEANEAYEIVKKQNLNLRNEMQELKKKLSDRDVQVETNKREKQKLEEQILNASRTMDDIRKYSSARDESLSPDSALGISITSLTDLSSGPCSPNSDISDSLFTPREDEMKLGPQETNGLLCKMPTMIENFRAVVRENEVMKTKILEVMSTKDKMSSQMKYYSTLSDDLQKQVGEKDQFLAELQTKARMLDEELNQTKNSLSKIERDFDSTASEADLIKTTLKVREETVAELREKVELLEEKEKALELYSKSMSEKYHNEAAQKSQCQEANKTLEEKNENQAALLESLEKKLSDYSSRPRRVSEPEVAAAPAQVPKPLQKTSTPVGKKTTELTMFNLEGKLESIVEYSEVLENSLMEVEVQYRSLQAEKERIQRDMVDREEYDNLRSTLYNQEESFRETKNDLTDRITNLEEQVCQLEGDNQEKESSLTAMSSKGEEVLQEYYKLKEALAPIREANAILKGELENAREEVKQADESRLRAENDLKMIKTKMAEIEMTTEAYKDENSRLRCDIIALSEEKCDVECKVSEAERREKRLNDLINQERAERQELKAEHETALVMCDTLQADLAKTKDAITKLESERNKTEQTNSEVESRLKDITTQKETVCDELEIARKDLQELEGRYKKTVDQEEALSQKVNKLNLENSRLVNAYEQSQKRKNDLERELVEANGKNEDNEAEMEQIRIEKAGLLKEIAKKEETIESMEIKKSELEEERQKLTNELYLSTKKVLSLQLNLESLRNDVTQLGKDLRRLVLGAIGREARDESEEKSMEADLEMSLFENEVVVQALRQTIKTTERNLDLIRPEAKISELENKLCQKDIDSVHREFAFLKDQLASFRHSCQKLSDETKRLKEDLNNKEGLLQETREHFDTLKDENTENKENLVQLQSKCNGLELLSAEYEQNAETSHSEIVRANQAIAALEATVAKQEQKKNAMEKERLVMQERLSNLENNQRLSKDEMRNDKKRIASLEVESSEKQVLSRELEKVENSFSELKIKYEDALKEREEVKAELITVREELRLEELELKNSKKDAENFKKHILIEREMRQRVEQDLSEHVEELKTSKKNVHTLERAQSKLQDDKENLQEKVKLLEETGQTFKKQLEVQSVELKRLKDSLTDTRNDLMNTNEKYDNAEKERKALLEELIHSEEQIRKLQDTCNELLKEKSFANDKVFSLNDTLDTMIKGHEDAVHNLKADLMVVNKDLSVTKSSLERSQQRNDELLQELKVQQDKMKITEERKQELLQKFWESQNQLGEAQSSMDSLTAETKDLKGRIAIHLSKIEHLEEALRQNHEESENTIESLNNKIGDLKTQGKLLSQERDVLQSSLDQAEEALSRTSEELKNTAKNLSEKEKFYTGEIATRDQSIDNLKSLSDAQRVELKKTKDTLRDISRENGELKEHLEVVQKTLEVLESKVNEQDNHNVDTLAEAQAKLKVVNKLKASNTGEHFVDLQSAPLLSSELDNFDFVDGSLDSPRDASIKDIVDAFHQTCMHSFNDNRELQDKLTNLNESNAFLEESLNQERHNMSETKRYLNELEKKKNKLEEEVMKLRKRLETVKQKSIELEKCKDDELCEVKGDKLILDKENWSLKEAVEELRVKNKETEAERDRYASEVIHTQRQVTEARNDIKFAQEQIDAMQEQLFDMKKRGFELEAREKSLQQQIAEKDKELYANETKMDELEKLYNAANEKKTELYAQMSKAEDKIRDHESKNVENETQAKEMTNEIAKLKSSLSEMKDNLAEATDKADAAKDKIEELEIQRGSLQASNEILKHQLALAKSENDALKHSYTTSQDESLNLSRALNDATISKDNLHTELKCLEQDKERLQDALNASESQLREAEDNLVKAFQESESLKRQMLKVQSTACAESVKIQTELSKAKSELESTKKDAHEKDKDHIEKALKLKSTEKELENLKKDLHDIHLRESELKLDYTTANSKLQSYVLERECWEREVKNVLGEIESQKSSNASKEHRLERLRMRYEQEIGFLSQRVSSLERELKIVQDAAEQQRHADDIAHKLNLEAKDMEIDNLRMRLQATRIHSSDKNTVVDQMKNQLDERTSQISDLMSQMSMLKDSYHLELASVQADLKCSQMENLLKLRKDMDSDNQLSSSHDSVGDLLEAIKTSRTESERLRHLLGNRMRQMSTLNRDINSKRSLGTGARSYGLYSRDNEGHLRD